MVSLSLIAQDKITTSLTENHLELPGTKFAVIPPGKSFSTSDQFTGLISEEYKAMINFTEMPMSLEMVIPMFAKDLPPEDGKVLIDRDLILNGQPAKLYKVTMPDKGMGGLGNSDKPTMVTQWLMLYSASKDECIVISGGYELAQDEKLSNDFEKTFLSFYYDEDKEVNPMDGLTFTLDDSKLNLKFASLFMQTGVFYNVDGMYPTASDDKTNFVVMMMPYPVPEDEQKEEAIQKVKKPFGKDNIQVTSTEAVEIGGLSGYEVVGYKMDGKKKEVLYYSVSLFSKKVTYIMNGFTKRDMDKLLKEFKEVAHTFEVK